MQPAYANKYLKNYTWSAISLALNFISMTIVIPRLTADPTVFGIYSICVSISIFFSYADLGFLGAGQKFASEYFAQGKLKEEISVLGFVGFILLIFLIVFSVIFVYLSFHPALLISEIKSENEYKIASSLLMILAVFTPVIFLQRIIQMIFVIRLDEYVVQRVNIFSNIIKILSIFIFFNESKNDVVNYYLFVQIVSFFSSIIMLVIARNIYNYDFCLFFKSIKFNKKEFVKTKYLAQTTFYLTITWILYYELDTLVISKYLGAHQVAIFAVGLTVLSFFRIILGIIYSPFGVRFNHLIGLNNKIGLEALFISVVKSTSSIVVLPIVAIVLFAEPLVLTWVGNSYVESIDIVKLLVMCNIFTFISYPMSLLLMAQERGKEMYIINTLIPIIYWFGIFISFQYLKLEAFAVFKLIAFIFSSFFYYILLVQFLKFNFLKAFNLLILPLIPPVIFLVIFAHFIVNILPDSKSIFNLLVTSITILISLIISYLIYFIVSSKDDYLKNVIYNFRFK